jgi:glucose-6-phosphate 1-dehydrogenase
MPKRTAPSVAAVEHQVDRRLNPHVIVLFGAVGDLSQRKLLPGLLRLYRAGLLPACRIVGTSLEELDDESFRRIAHEACTEHVKDPIDDGTWEEFAELLRYVPSSAGAGGLHDAVVAEEEELAEAERTATASGAEPREVRRLHYLSIPPAAARQVVTTLGEAGLADRARIVMEKPFGTDLASAQELNAHLQAVFPEESIFRIDHFLGKEAALNILAFRFANGLFEPIWNRQHIDHVQIDVPETLSISTRAAFYESAGAFRDMVVTHLFQIMAFVAMEPPTALEPRAINEEKNKVFRSMLPIASTDVVRGQFAGYRDIDGVDPESQTDTFVALRCHIDNWRWAGVPFFLRTGKKLAEGARIVSIAFKEPPKSMFPAGSGVGTLGPDHLTFDLADSSRLSLSFYGKRPGPGFVLDKLSMQFATHETPDEVNVLEAYERLIHDALAGDKTLFTSSEGIERLWEVAAELIEDPPLVHPYFPGSWGPDAMHALVAPYTWRLPFERRWRTNET